LPHTVALSACLRCRAAQREWAQPLSAQYTLLSEISLSCKAPELEVEDDPEVRRHIVNCSHIF
jgi:hypothetical protein